MQIKLIDLVKDDTAFGNEEGRVVFHKLSSFIDSHPADKIFGISLQGIRRTDASFPRESVISLAKSRREEKGFYLRDFSSKDLMDNWDYAAKAKNQPMMVLTADGYTLIGPDISSSARELLDFIYAEGQVTTSKVAAHFGVSSQNASGKLKKLYIQGLIVGGKEVAESGGMEFQFRAIK